MVRYNQLMSLRLYLFIMSAMTAFCLAALGFIVFTVDPETTNGTGFFLFYSSWLLSIIGLAALIGFIIRFVVFRRDLASKAVKTAFRQSFFFAGFIVIMLILLSRGLFSWLNAVILIIGLSLLEFFLLSYGNNKTTIAYEE